MKNVLLRGLVLCWLALMGVGGASAQDVRFSQSLNAEDKAAAGLARLSSDEVAVIDALVRRDTAARGGTTAPESSAATFSQRLTADERGTAGLSKLTPAELPKLDALVDRHQNARLARTLLAPLTYVSRSPSRVTPTERKKEREIHGSFSLSYGVGSGGYSEKSGSMVLTLDDPQRNFSISIGYSETHTKGGYGGYLYRDPFYDPLRNGPMDTVAPFKP